MCADPSRLVLQFHITGRCNLRCKHCYRTEGDIEPLTYENILAVIDQFQALCQRYNAQHGIKKRGHINLTGGEPFIRQDIREILTVLGQRQNRLTYGVLTNGSYIDHETIALLKETGVSFVQLSLDGNPSAHDHLRAEGDYQRVLRVAKMLEGNGVRTHISFTAHQENYHYLPQVARDCRKAEVSKLWSDRLVPIGNGQELENLAITAHTLPLYLEALNKARGGWLTRHLCSKTHVGMNRALQFLASNETIYSCTAGASLITVDEKGQVMPCRRLPLVCGDVFSSTLEEIYYHHPTMVELRRDTIPTECQTCDYSPLCRGGAKCQSYATYGDLHRADPACYLTKKL